VRTLWLVVAFLLGAFGPFLAFSFLPPVPTAALVSLICLLLAGFAVRESAKASARASAKDPRL
jgi:hypothetical protein